MKAHRFELDADADGLARMREFLVGRREGMLRLLENPNLLEHESFTDLLWAVFHLTDELLHRDDLGNMPDSDRAHLRGDAVRAARLLYGQWLGYMFHLKKNYPYLFSLAVRMNPFDPDRGPVVKT